MLLLVTGLFFALCSAFLRSRYPVSAFLFFLYAGSFFCGWIIGKDISIIDGRDLFNFLFTVLVLSGFALVFCQCDKKMTLSISNLRFFKVFGVFLGFALFLSLIINIYIVVSSIEYVVSGNVSVTKFKNQGEAARLIREWVNPSLVFYANLVSGAGLIAILYHFYYLNENKRLLSGLFFLLSLNLPLVGLHALSRASTVQFVLMYACIYFYIYHALEPAIRKRFNIRLCVVGGFFVVSFLLITYYRFSGSSFYDIPEDSLIKNRVFYSIFDYFSQWINNSIVVLGRFSLEDMWFGRSSSSLLDYIFERLGFDVQPFTELSSNVLGIYGSRFNGLVSMLVYDFSYIGVFAFLFLFYLVVKFVSNEGPVLDGFSVPVIAFMVSVPILFFSNNYLANELFSLSGLYAVLFVLLSKIRYTFESKGKEASSST